MPTKPTGRPRGRPKGSKNIPKAEDLIFEALRSQVPIPEPKPKAAPRGPWASMTPEQRSEHARKLSLARKTHGGGRLPGVPRSLTKAQFEAREAAQEELIDKVFKKMAKDGTLPEDAETQEVLREVLKVVRTQESVKDKLAAARLFLDFTKAKPTAKIEHTVRTAEDILDEMGED